MAGCLRTSSLAVPSSFHRSVFSVKLCYLKCGPKPHDPLWKTKAQVTTIPSAPITAPLGRRFSHLEDLAQQLFSSEDVSSAMEPWIGRLTIHDWHALLINERLHENWHFALQMLSVLKENRSLLDDLPVEPIVTKQNLEGEDYIEHEDERHGESTAESMPTEALLHKETEGEDCVQWAPKSMPIDGTAIKKSKELTRMEIYCKIASVLARNEKYEEINTVIEQMQQTGIKPNAFFYSKIIGTLLACGQIDQANVFFSQAENVCIKPDHFVYEKLALAYLHEENPDTVRATQILNDLMKGNQPISKRLFTELMKTHWAAKNVDGIEEVFELMQNAGHTPDLKAFVKVMQIQGRYGNYERVLELLEMLDKFGLKPNAGVYDCLLLAYCKAGLVEKAKETFSKYQMGLGVRPSSISHNMLIDVLGKQGLHEEALQMFTSMPFRPTIVSYNSIIPALVKAGDIKRAEQLYYRMLRENIQPSVPTSMALIQGFTRLNQTRRGHQFYNHMKRAKLEMREGAYCSALRLYVEGNWYMPAAMVLVEMEERGLPLDAAAHGSLIRSFGILEPYALTPLARAIQKSNYDICKLLSSLFLSTESPRADSEYADLLGPFLQSWDILDATDAKEAVYNAFLDCFWKKNLKATARRVLDLARKACLSATCPKVNVSELTLDLRGFSVGGAKLAFCDWVSSIDGVPRKNKVDGKMVLIMAGDESSSHSSQDSNVPMKDALISWLEELNFPFVKCGDDSKTLQASVVEVLTWMLEDSVKAEISLVNV